MHDIIDLHRYPLDQPDSAAYATLVADSRAALARDGLFNLEGFLLDAARIRAVNQIGPRFATEAFNHKRRHNIYFKPAIDGLDADHPALAEVETSNHTICADQIPGSDLIALYEWPPFIAFLADVMDRAALYPMTDPLARLNVMAYGDGEALNWHFDRSEFTTTLLLQAPDAGGVFEYAKDLRSAKDPNYDGVADLLTGAKAPTQMVVEPGTLNVFKGVNTAHRVTEIEGNTPRIITVLTYYEYQDAEFSDAERMGFYGRVTPVAG